MAGGKRLTYYIEKQGFTKTAFCNEHGFDYPSFTQILVETRPLGIKIINKIHESLPKLNVHWLLYGEGPEEITDNEMLVLNEPAEMYTSQNDSFEYLLLKYMDNEKIKKKIYEIINEK